MVVHEDKLVDVIASFWWQVEKVSKLHYFLCHRNFLI